MIYITQQGSKMKVNDILFEILQNDKNKKSYITRTLSKFSEILKEISNSNISLTLKKHTYKLYYNDFKKNLNSSKLKDKELSFTLNLLNARYKEYLIKS